MKVDCVGACVGVRGSRIKNIVDDLGGERIDIVRWNDSLQVLIPNALQPAQIEEVFLYPRLGRAIVLVKEDQLSLAIGRRGQNVRLARKLVGWDIEIMTHDELNNSIEQGRAVGSARCQRVTEEMVEAFIEEGFLSYDDLTFLEPAELAELAGVTEEQAEDIIDFAEDAAEQLATRHGSAARSRPPTDEGAGRAAAAAPRPRPHKPARRRADARAGVGRLGGQADLREPVRPAARRRPRSRPRAADRRLPRTRATQLTEQPAETVAGAIGGRGRPPGGRRTCGGASQPAPLKRIEGCPLSRGCGVRVE